MKVIDLTGMRFNRWTVQGRGPNNTKGQAQWVCKCDCGSERLLVSVSVRTGHSKSCGCLKLEVLKERSTKHGHAHMGKISPTYQSWAGMLARCTDANHKNYAAYGGRGIKVCERWKSFKNFLADMGEKPAGTSLDRKDVNKGYTKANCRWATPIEQGRNKRSNRLMTLNGVTKTMQEWCELLDIKPATLSYRVCRGWSDVEALTTPVRQVPGLLGPHQSPQ